MLEVINGKLAEGVFETSIAVHGPTTQVVLKVQIIAVDTVGMVAKVKGMLGGWSDPTAYPWTAISKVVL